MLIGMLYIAFVFNFLLGIITPILPLLIFSLTGSLAHSGYMMGVFMLALFLTRLYLFYVPIPSKKLIHYAQLVYTLGFLLACLGSANLSILYLAALGWGIGIAIAAPALISLLGDVRADPAQGVKDHNIVFALASCLAPFIGYFVYQHFTVQTFYLITFSLACSALLVGLFTFRRIPSSTTKQGDSFSLGELFADKRFMGDVFVFLIICISYGCLVAYLPILLEARGLRIDLFFSVYWVSFILAQLVVVNYVGRCSERSLLLFLILLVSLSLLIIPLMDHYLLVILSAILYGFAYGALMLYFYSKAAASAGEQRQRNSISFIGIVVYIGIGLGAFLFAPLAERSVEQVFYIVPAFSIALLLFFSILWVKTLLNRASAAKREL